MLFLGDSTSEDFFHNGYMDQEKLGILMQMIQSVIVITAYSATVSRFRKKACWNT